jgi:hypothetical protein
MTVNEKSAAAPGVYSFNEIVDETCDKLMDKQIKHSIRRIMEMEERLESLEKELDDFILQKNKEN